MDVTKNHPESNGCNAGLGMTFSEYVTMDQEEVNSVDVSILPAYGECPAQGLLLCYWNNIIGPHAHCVWQIAGKPEFTQEQLKYLSTHTLTSSDNPASAINSKLLFLEDQDAIVHIFLFSGYQRSQKVTFALSLVIPFQLKDWYLSVHSFCEMRLTSMVRRLRVLQEKYKNEENSPAIQAFSAKVPDFLRSITRLSNFGLPKKIELNDTVFASGQDKHLDVQFMRKAIAGHLQSCGCSVVIGNSVAEINMVLYTLALFLSPSERQYSLRLTKDSSQFPFKYEADVQLQGFLKTSFEVEDSLLSIMASRYPTSLVDLTTLEVKQMYHYNEHEYMRHEVITKELQHTWLESKEPIPVLRFSKEIETDTLVENFQKEMYMLNPEGGVREAFLLHFARLLDRKALLLIKYVEDETHRGKYPFKVSVRKLKADLDLTPDGNFRIVIAHAEKLQPGIYSMVCGSLAVRGRDILEV
ncbi:guanine nucleotide exchange factor C9orf72-like [Apostichopus japonicus]|uniref:guanine nucleotide exchange factor C9orf72-like n=1 Tax=Stichopus japonicus TaxID=307972 RepID=UPI003AB3B370